jgi:hypothetical protein
MCRIMCKFSFRKKLLSLAAASLASMLLSVPARAQNPYWYLYMGQSLLYPLTRGLMMPYFYGPYSSNPFYSTSSFLRRNMGMAAQYPYVYPYSQYANTGYRNFGLPAGQSVTGVIDPYTGRTNPNNSNNSNKNGQNAAGNSSQATAGSLADGDGSGSNSSGSANTSGDPNNFYLPGPQTQSLYATPPQSFSSASASSSAAMPPLAPAVSKGAGQASDGKVSMPIADGFVSHLVTKYDGNIQKALGNGDTRNWAKAMGVIENESHDSSSLSPDRVEVIGRILKDGSLDSVSKVDAVRILLKQKPVGQ